MTNKIVFMLLLMIAGAAASVSIAGDISLSDGQIQFMGQAEEEITNKTYDKNLWAKALIEAEGDEEKRKAKYILLRSRQLYLEANPSLINAVPEFKAAPSIEESKYKFARAYKIRFGVNGSYQITGGKNNLIVRVRQEGNKVSGKLRYDLGEFTGVIEGNQLNLEWLTIYGEGTGKLKISRDGKKLEGTWKAKSGGSGKWVMTAKR